MNYPKFLELISTFYEHWQDFNPSLSPEYQEIISQISGDTTANVLQLVKGAMDCLETHEVYCEIGCFPGRSLIAALKKHPHRHGLAIDNFSQGNRENDSLEIFTENLEKFGVLEQVFFYQQDFESFFLELQELRSSEKIGIFFYDGALDYRSVFLALLLGKNFWEKRALIFVKNSHLAPVHQAIWDFMAVCPQCQECLDLSPPELRENWNGLRVLTWEGEQTFNYDAITFQNARKSELLQALSQVSLSYINQGNQHIQSLYQQALILHKNGNIVEAEKHYLEVLNLEPEHPSSLSQLAMIDQLNGRDQEAREKLLKLLKIKPNDPMNYYNLGLVSEKLGDIWQAVSAYQKALELAPEVLDIYNNLGNIFCRVGQEVKGENLYRKAIEINPNHWGSYVNLGNLLLQQQKLDEAILTYEIALNLNPQESSIEQSLEFLKILKNDPIQQFTHFGNDCYYRDDYHTAIQYYEQVLSLSQGTQDLYTNLIYCHQKTTNYNHAIKLCQTAINFYPDQVIFYHKLIELLIEINNPKAAIMYCERFLHKFPNEFTFNQGSLFILPIFYQTFPEIYNYRNRFIEGLNRVIKDTPLTNKVDCQHALNILGKFGTFLLFYQGKNDKKILERYSNFVHQVMQLNYPQWTQPQALSCPQNKRKRIKVGYISGCFWSHPVGKLMLGWITHHTPEDFEIYCYHVNVTQDQITQQFRQNADVFHYIPNHLEKICQQISKDQLQILVFLDIGQQTLLTQIAALKLAPIQVVTWGHPVTSGLPTIDYFLSNQLMETETAQNHYTETLIKLPNLGVCYAPPTIPPLSKKREDFGLKKYQVVYLCCQLLSKYLPQYDYVLAEIAHRVPECQFVFIARPNMTVGKKFLQRLQKNFAQFGLNSQDYCRMLPTQNVETYWSLFQLTDVFLDTWEWSGGQTSLDAIACHLPIVTCPGELMRSRQSYGILQRLTLTETIAENEQHYIEIAVRLGQDPQWRQTIIEKIIKNLPRLYHDTSTVKALEDFYRHTLTTPLT